MGGKTEYVQLTDVPDGWEGIYTAEDLIAVSEDVPGDKCCIQMADIDLSGVAWVSIGGNIGAPFSGKYNGNGYKIKNLSSDGGGLFNMLYPGAELSNIYLSNVTINSSSGGVGGLFNFANSDDDLIAVNNCTVVGKVISAGSNAGGIFEFVTGNIEVSNCRFSGEVSGSYAGGLGGYALGGEIKNCVCSNTEVEGSSRVGGLLGECNRGAVVIGCEFYGSVKSTGDDTGGAIGYLGGEDEPSSVTSCKTCTNVSISSVDGCTGGFVGQIVAGNVSKCCFQGNIEGSSDRIGGFVGGCYADVYIEECYVIGSIKAFTGNNYVGGFAGHINSKEVTNCYIHCDVISAPSSEYIGGFAGLTFADIDKCYSVGSVINNSTKGFIMYSFANAPGDDYPTNSFYNCDVSGILGDLDDGIVPLTTEEMKSIDTYDGWDIVKVDYAHPGDVAVWGLVDGHYPALLWDELPEASPLVASSVESISSSQIRDGSFRVVPGIFSNPVGAAVNTKESYIKINFRIQLAGFHIYATEDTFIKVAGEETIIPEGVVVFLPWLTDSIEVKQKETAGSVYIYGGY